MAKAGKNAERAGKEIENTGKEIEKADKEVNTTAIKKDRLPVFNIEIKIDGTR